jgi:hypothetical protein
MSAETATASRERIILTKENRLRETLLQRVESLETSALNTLARIVREFIPNADATLVHSQLRTAVGKAVRAVDWSSGTENDKRIQIGYYRNDAEYFTTMLHEGLHVVLGALGRPLKQYMNDPIKEEDACWRFARSASRLLSVPYDQVREDLSREFYVLEEKLKDQANAHLWDQYIAKERRLTGFSSYGGDTFEWKDDAPVVKIKT